MPDYSMFKCVFNVESLKKKKAVFPNMRERVHRRLVL